jgi:hypothetical protein
VFRDGLFVCFLQFLFGLVVEILISAYRLSRLLPKFIGAAHNIDCSGALHFPASLNCSFRQHPFGASFIEYCYAPASSIASCGQSTAWPIRPSYPYDRDAFRPKQTPACGRHRRGCISSRRLQAGRRRPFVDVSCGLCLASFPQERLALFAHRRRDGLSSQPLSLMHQAVAECNRVCETVSLHNAAACDGRGSALRALR